ncbi:Alkaline extracellular protease [Yarrowia sp. C11]|nr:Alkaline extracellular protease [Yarrowia sp. C11]
MKFSKFVLFGLVFSATADSSPSEAYKSIKAIIHEHRLKLENVISRRQVSSNVKSFIISFPGASIDDISHHISSIDDLVSGKAEQGITTDFDVSESPENPNIVGVAAVLDDSVVEEVERLPFALVEPDGKIYMWDSLERDLERNPEGVVYCDQLPGFGAPGFEPFYDDELLAELSVPKADQNEQVATITTDIVGIMSADGLPTIITSTITYTSTLKRTGYTLLAEPTATGSDTNDNSNGNDNDINRAEGEIHYTDNQREPCVAIPTPTYEANCDCTKTYYVIRKLTEEYPTTDSEANPTGATNGHSGMNGNINVNVNNDDDGANRGGPYSQLKLYLQLKLQLKLQLQFQLKCSYPLGYPAWYAVGLSRISHKSPELAPYDNAISGNYIHQEFANPSPKVVVYVVDSGVNINHENFATKPIWLANVVDNVDSDSNGHGTFVAGVVAGTKSGVDPNVQIKSVKVFSGDATDVSILMTGITRAINDFKADTTPGKKGVLNLSLGGDTSTALDALITQAVAEGLFVAIAAGNSMEDACNNSPGRASSSTPGSVTVGSINRSDQLSVFDGENKGTAWGTCVTGFAPGSDIFSSMNTPDNGYGIGAGTSFAAPMVAGIAAYMMSQDGTKDLSPAELETIIMNNNNGQIQGDIKNSPNKIAHNGV